MRFIECVVDWFRPAAKKTSASRAADVAVDVLSVAPIPPVAAVAPGIVATAPARRDRYQGHIPTVTVSRNRTRCEGCKELVFRNLRHICIYNAHHHIDSLTAAERAALIAQLKALAVKPAAVPKPVAKALASKRKPRKRSTRRSLQ